MRRYPKSLGTYRDAPLYCGEADTSTTVGWGFRHLSKHLGEIDGSWQSFDTEITGVLEFPIHIQPGTSIYGTLDHVGKVSLCHVAAGEEEVWGFHVITNAGDAKVITAYAERKKGQSCG
jgi:hypothetical protein